MSFVEEPRRRLAIVEKLPKVYAVAVNPVAVLETAREATANDIRWNVDESSISLHRKELARKRIFTASVRTR